jgi:serine-type D-Ala-D-Ala carboxypeptidase
VAARLAAERFAPTGDTRPRAPAPGQEGRFAVPPQPRRRDPGQVDDDNAYALGGAAGHAGLFSTARDLARLGQGLLEELDGAGRLGAAATLAAFVRESPCAAGARRGLGFDLPAPTGSAVGERFGRAGPRGAIGHLGFTGCSLWVDLDRRISAALVTNRVYHGRGDAEGIRRLRPAFHDLVAERVGDGRPPDPPLH